MDGLLRYEAGCVNQVPANARHVFDILALLYFVEFESPDDSQLHPEWFVQVRFLDGPVIAGFYGESASAAAERVLASLPSRTAA